ncbi:MAG TPA: DNA polymerase III subunit [Gemmatimonadales bacterium]|jgi:DNA polymerase-3 subunit delta'
MTIAPLYGQPDAVRQLDSAVVAGRLPQVLLVTGPRGVGKQRVGLWLAQRLLCTALDAKPCGTCNGCMQVLGLSHPDFHWFIPVARPKAGDPARQAEEAAELIEAAVAERRASPVWATPDGMASHSIASARLIQRQASLTSVAGGWRVFLIGQADRLVPQESSQEAANAMLKLLEEPPARSLFILTTSEPGRVLPTIRSRATPIRLGRIADVEVRQFLAVAKPELANDVAISRAHGSIGNALASANQAQARARTAADEFLKAVAGGPAQAAERALRQQPFQARGEFTDFLDAVADRLAARAARVLGADGRVPSGNSIGVVMGIERVMEARERAQGNVNPQLLLAVLADDLATLEAV